MPAAHAGMETGASRSRFDRAPENTLAALVPIVVIAARQTQIISESITAYSTAVGPSSDTKNDATW